MRGADEQTGALFSYLSPEAMVPKDHPLRAIRPLVNAALARLSPAFARLYAPTGRVSIAPEKLLRALLLQAFYSVRSERQLMEQLTYNMLFRWFVGLSMDAPVWDVTVFAKNRERLLEGDIARAFLRECPEIGGVRRGDMTGRAVFGWGIVDGLGGAAGRNVRGRREAQYRSDGARPARQPPRYRRLGADAARGQAAPGVRPASRRRRASP